MPGPLFEKSRETSIYGRVLKTLRTSSNPTRVVTANGEVQTNEEAQVHVHDLDLFVTVQILDDTPAVLSLGKLCGEHGYTYEWDSGRTPHLTMRRKGFHARRKMSCLLLSQDCGQAPAQVRLLHRFRKTHQVPFRVQHVHEVTNMRRETDAILPQPETKEKNIQQAAGNRLRDLPEWLEEFTDNLEDAEVQELANTSHGSDSNRPTKVTSRNHCIYTHFPTDRNCDVCLRTKMTRVLC